ncbi:MAG: elongation factor P [Acidobacteria bacterium]|nr:elongation factor P [Acidobacteriota bacterium]
MSSVQASRLKKGMLIKFDGALVRVLDVQHMTPGNLRALVRGKMRDIKSNRLVDHKFRADAMVERAILDERQMQYLFRDGEMFVFMDTENYEQVHLSVETLGDSAQYLLPDAVISVEFYEEAPMGIHLPLNVDLKVVDTAPGIKGATASAQVKPATLETGLVVNVPSFINNGDVIRVNTETGDYLSRV